MIVPTPGRIVWFRPHAADRLFIGDVPLAAMIVRVHSDTCVNLVVWDSSGNAHPRSSVWLVQDGYQAPPEGNYAEWMPYQKGQAAKAEALESQLAKGAE